MKVLENLIKGSDHLKLVLIDDQGIVLMSSKGSIDSFGEFKRIQDLFNSVSEIKPGEYYHVNNHDHFKDSYKINIGEESDGKFLVSISNLTLALEIEKQLEISQQENDLLVDLVNESSIVAITDLKGNIKYINEKFIDISGYSEKELLGKNQSIVSSGYHGPSFWKEMWKTIGKGKTWKGEIKNKSKNGTFYWVETTIKPRLENGKPIEYVSVRTDITQRKELEFEMAKKAVFYQNAAQLSQLGCWEIDVLNQTPIWDDKVREIHGVGADYMPDMSSALDFYPPESKVIVEAHVQKAFEKGTGWEFELPMIKATGEKIWVKAIGKVDKEGEDIQRIYGVFQDVSSKREAESNKREKALAEKKAEFRESFLANMSHEIRTPMNGVIGIVDLLLTTELDEYQQELLEIVQNSSSKLLNILNDILDLSKIQAGKFELQDKPFSVSGLVKQIRSIFHPLVTQKALEFKIMLDPDLPEFVQGDETRVFQVLSNVVSNAVKFTDEGKVELGCSIVKKNQIQFTIKDSGIGIPRDKVESIFVEFSQMEDSYSNNIKGTGLGLSISKRLIHLMGGSIEVDSEEGKGSVFTITLPLEVSVRKVFNPTSSEAEITYSKRVLVVEDNTTNQKVVGLMLKKLNLEYDQAFNGKEALEMYNPSEHGVIFMDVNMPIMGGDECTSKLREQEVKAKIIALTGNAMEKDINNYLEKGYDDYITKPLAFKVLKKVLTNL